MLTTVSGVQYADLNENGLFDTGDVPIEGVAVFLDLNDNDWPDAGEPAAVSGADGSYVIPDVTPGDYLVRSVTPRYYRPESSGAVSSDRLFGTSRYADASSPTQYSVRLSEIDPLTGVTLAQHDTDIPANTLQGLAYDGQRLILIDRSFSLIYELASDGTVLDSGPLSDQINPTNGQPQSVNDYGPVVINGTIFSLRWDRPYLTEYDPYDNEFIDRGPLTYDWGLETLPVTHQATAPTPTYAVGASADGQSIILGSTDDRVFTIDPSTGIATFDSAAMTSDGTDYARASVDGETFVAFHSSVGIKVYDAAGNLNRTLTGLPTMFGLGGGSHLDSGVAITVSGEPSIANINQGYVSTLLTISGTISDDSNGNGAVEAGEPPVSGVTVYLDANRNAQPDSGELTTVTDASGQYTFTDVAPAVYQVRQVAPANRQSHAITDDVTRVFTHVYDSSAATVTIYELDPKDGHTLREYPAPGTLTGTVGLAMTDSHLFLASAGNLFKLDPDTGSELSVISLPPGTIDGLAIIDGTAYVQRPETDTIDVVDLQTRRVIRQLDLGLINNGVAGSIDLVGALGESSDGNSLAVRSGSDVLIVDPITGLIAETLASVFPNFALAGAGGELFEPSSAVAGNQSFTRVLDHLGLLRRQIVFPIDGQATGYAARQTAATAHNVRVFAGRDLGGLDFGNFVDTGSVSGIQFDDLNGDGQRDVGEPPLPGVTVFVDHNANDWPDPGEPAAVSAADGTYTITGIPYGRHIIRTVSPANYRPTTISYSANRLLATRGQTDTASPTGEYLQVRELDPLTGTILSRITTTTPSHAASSTAYDGQRIIMVDNNADLIYELASDGTVIDQTPLPGAPNPAFVYGPVIIDGTIYLLMSEAGTRKLTRYDADTNVFYGDTPLSHLPDAYLPEGTPIFSVTLSESPDGKSILAFSRNDDRVLEIDPLTARVTDVLVLPDTSFTDYASTSVGGELMLTSSGSGGLLDVYDAQYNLLRSMPNPLADGLGGGFYADDAVAVTVTPATVIADVDHGHQSTRIALQGSITVDTNHNGMADSGEPAAVGETVFLDANRNGIADVGEFTTLTDANGQYAFTDLPAGDYVVRQANVAGVRSLANAGPVTRLFALNFSGGVSTINELDPLTGQVLNHFPAPGTPLGEAGLAFDDHALYYASSDGLWLLDPDTGGVFGFIDLAPTLVNGVAAIGGHVFVMDSTSEQVLKFDPLSGTLVSTLDINAINLGHAVGTVDLNGALGESVDGTKLYTRTDNYALYINPSTGVIDQWSPVGSDRYGLAAAGNEMYLSSNTSIAVETDSGLVIRRFPVGFIAYGIAAAEVTAAQHSRRAAPGVDVSDLNFLSQTDLDFGDAPNSYGTTLGSDGPRHIISAGVRLGATVTGEPDASTPGGDPDDNGVIIGGPLAIGRDHSFEIETSASGTLAVWIDHNGNGTFDNASERTQFDIGSPGVQSIVVSLPANATAGTTHARFRFSTDSSAIVDPTGAAPDGEVEDYSLLIAAPPTDLSLSNASINENIDTSAADLLVGSLSAIDATPADSFTYALVSGPGDGDNARFLINGDQLMLNRGETIDAETQSSYSVRILVSDSTGLSTQKPLTVHVNDLVELTDADITLDDGSGQRSAIDSLSVRFDSEVAIEPDAFVVRKRGANGGDVDVSFNTIVDAQGRTVASLAFSGPFTQQGGLVDGNYDLRIVGSKVTSVVGGWGLDANRDGVTGDDYTFGDVEADAFFRLFGDGNGDGNVNLFDFAAFRSTFGLAAGSPQYLGHFDATGDELINLFDFAAFRASFGQSNVFE